MRIRFERTMDDMIAFNDFHYRNSPYMKKFLFWYRFGGGLAVFLLSTLLIQVLSPGGPGLIAPLLSLIGACVFAAIAPQVLQRRIRRQVRRLCSEGKNTSALGEIELEVIDTGLITKSAYAETKLAWGAIERIESTPDYTFLYTSSVQAYIIPHNRILEGDYRALMAEIGLRFQPGAKLPQIIA